MTPTSAWPIHPSISLNFTEYLGSTGSRAIIQGSISKIQHKCVAGTSVDKNTTIRDERNNWERNWRRPGPGKPPKVSKTWSEFWRIAEISQGT